MFLLLGQIILTFIYYCKISYSLKKYLFVITEQYLSYLLSLRTISNKNTYNNSINIKSLKNEPVKKKK